MTIEVATLISDLNAAYPAAADFLYEGDDHIRLLKSTVKATFPNVTGIVTATHTNLNRAGGPGSWILQAKTLQGGGTPATIDFINGTGGVVMDSTFDAHWIDINGCDPVTTSELRVQLSTDAGTSWSGIGASPLSQAINCAAGTVSGSVTTLAQNFRLSGGRNVVSGGTARAHGHVMFVQNIDQGTLLMMGRLIHGAAASEETSESMLRAGVTAALGNPINGIRLLWSSGNFASASSATYRLYSRKVS